MPYNVLRGATIRNSTACRYSANAGYSVDWLDNDDFGAYTEYSGLTTRLVWDRNYMAVSTSGVCYIGPATDQEPFDGDIYHLVSVTFRVEPGERVDQPTLGRLAFQTTDDPTYSADKTVDFSITVDNAYNEYIIDMSAVKTWQGDIIRLRLYPFINGFPGIVVHFKALKTMASSGAYVHECSPGAGGSCRNLYVADGIDIEEGVNDKLLVNINGYGEQGATLTPVRGALLSDIARDLEEKLSNVAIGGYAGCRVTAEFGVLTIFADDTREASSTVVVSDTPAARTLGFYDSEGNDTSTAVAGEDAADHYAPMGTIQLSRAEIAKLYAPDPATDAAGIDIRPDLYAVQAGRSDFSLTFKERKLDALDKTIIEFNNPITNNGIITSVAYSGDGTGETEFKFFRPKADGSLTQYASVNMGISGSKNDKLFEKAVSVRVRKGDLVGLYHAKLDLGKTQEFPNVSYFLYDGNVDDGDTIGPLDVEGRGERGLRLFAHGARRATEAVLDIEFDKGVLLEEINVYAEEENRAEEINLSRARVGGVNGGPYIESETGVDKYGGQAPAMTGAGALTDGVRHNTPSAETYHPSWLDSAFEPSDRYEQTSFSATLDFAKGIPVFFNINRVVLYFRDSDNIKYFSIQYPWTTDEEDVNRYFGPVADRYSEVYLEGKLLEPDDHPIYDNPIHPTVDNYIHSYRALEFHSADFRFDPVRARTIRYVADNFFYNDNKVSLTLSDFPIASSPHILEMEVYAESTPRASITDNFYFESSESGENYVVHTQSRSEGSTSAAYLIGYPAKFLRAHIAPQGRLRLDGFLPTLSQAKTRIKANTPEGTVSLNSARNDYSSTEAITVVNEGNTAFNYFVSVLSQRSSVERCILWNKMGTPEELSASEIGPSPSVVKRPDYYPRETNYAYLAPAYMVDPYWLLNGDAKTYISYDHGASWASRGNTLTNYSTEDHLTAHSELYSSYIFVYILIDLGAVYALEDVTVVNPAGAEGFTGPAYSSRDVDDPAELSLSDDFRDTASQMRWLRFRAFSRAPGATASVGKISYVYASFNVLHYKNKGKIRWVPVPRLTNYTLGDSRYTSGEGWHSSITNYTHWYAVDLEDTYNITNIIVGPISDYVSYIEDFDVVAPGGVGSLFTTTSKANSAVGYSSSNTSDLDAVIWRPLGEEPGGWDRWLLLKKKSGVFDEVIVNIEDNVAENKPAFGSERWWTALRGEVRKDRQTFWEGRHSIGVTYAANTGPLLEELELTQSLGIDHALAPRDQLRIYFYVSDVEQLDLTKGHFAIGRNTTEDNKGRSPLSGVEKDTDNYFQWNFSDLDGLITTGWNTLHLPFTANFRVGRPYFEVDDQHALRGAVASGRSRFRWFRVSFAGVESNEEFQVNVDGIKIVRADFVPARFGNGYYLSGDDYAKFPLHNFNPLRGTIEFFINPDWTKNYWRADGDDSLDHTIFRFFNADGYVLGAFITGKGLLIYLSDGNRHYTLTDNHAGYINVGQNTHFALSWDLVGEPNDPALTVYLNNAVSSSFEKFGLVGGDFKQNPNALLMLGGRAWDGITAERTSSVDGVIENLKVYNYPIADFSYSLENEGLLHTRPGDELVEVSVDGVNFYGSARRGDELPLLVRNVPPGGSFNVYVRRREPPSLLPPKGQELNSYIEIVKAVAG